MVMCCTHALHLSSTTATTATATSTTTTSTTTTTATSTTMNCLRYVNSMILTLYT